MKPLSTDEFAHYLLMIGCNELSHLFYERLCDEFVQEGIFCHFRVKEVIEAMHHEGHEKLNAQVKYRDCPHLTPSETVQKLFRDMSIESSEPYFPSYSIFFFEMLEMNYI